MASIIKHPRYDQAAAAPVKQLEKSVEADRQRAVAMLGKATAKLEQVWLHHGGGELMVLGMEYGVLLNALQTIDPANIDDGMLERLEHIQGRLLESLEVLKKCGAGALPD